VNAGLFDFSFYNHPFQMPLHDLSAAALPEILLNPAGGGLLHQKWGTL
jgi:hypothetical protein